MDMGFGLWGEFQTGMWTSLFLFPVAYCANKYEQTSVSFLENIPSTVANVFSFSRGLADWNPFHTNARFLTWLCTHFSVSLFRVKLWAGDSRILFSVRGKEYILMPSVPKGVHLWASIVPVFHWLSSISWMINECGGKWAVRYQLWNRLLLWIDVVWLLKPKQDCLDNLQLFFFLRLESLTKLCSTLEQHS